MVIYEYSSGQPHIYAFLIGRPGDTSREISECMVVRRVGKNHVLICLHEKLPYIRSYTVQVYGCAEQGLNKNMQYVCLERKAQ
jgi:hypothetical protein